MGTEKKNIRKATAPFTKEMANFCIECPAVISFDKDINADDMTIEYDSTIEGINWPSKIADIE